MSNLKKFVLAGYILSISIIITLGLGVTTGVKGAITWGPTNDFWAMSIAISKIEYGLGGYLGYREVSQELANHLSSTKSDTNVGDLKTRDLVQDPKLINFAIQKASTLDQKEFKKGDKWNGHYLVYSEDIGFIDYYKIAFNIFGYNAYSGYYLYILLYLISLLIFYLRYKNNITCMISAIFITISIFGAANSAIMSDLMISIGSNRFLSTLIFIPLLHIIYDGSIGSEKDFFKKIIFLVLQLLILFFIFSIRITALWSILFIIFILFTKITIIFFKYRNYEFKKIFFNKAANYTLILFITILIGGTFKIIQIVKVDKVYHSQDLLPHHLVWHSAYIGLNQHPKWQENLPHPDLRDAQGDSIPFIITNHVLKDTGISIVGGVGGSGGTKNRLHDQIIKKEYFKFIFNNPKYALELFFIHKPMIMLSVLYSLYLQTKIYVYVLALFSILCTIVLLINQKKGLFSTTSILTTSFFISIFSSLPILWAYPATFVLADQFVAFFNLILSATLFTIYFIFNLFIKLKLGIDIYFFRKFLIILNNEDQAYLNNYFSKLYLYLKNRNII